MALLAPDIGFLFWLIIAILGLLFVILPIIAFVIVVRIINKRDKKNNNSKIFF